MISASPETLHERAESWAGRLGQGQVIPGESTVGGGSLPGETLPTSLLAVRSKSPDRLLASLRQTHPPVIARLENDLLVLDPRTILPEQDETLLSTLRPILG
jgi:L-seryl-tRNA(Ser) seleniumtransferase